MSDCNHSENEIGICCNACHLEKFERLRAENELHVRHIKECGEIITSQRKQISGLMVYRDQLLDKIELLAGDA